MSEESGYSLKRTLLLSSTVFISYLAVAMALPVISLFATDKLGRSTAEGGLAVGIAFLTTIFTRGMAGRWSDNDGGRKTTRKGLVIYTLASLICVIPAHPGLHPLTAYSILLAGRLLLGVGESLTLVGIMTWGINNFGAAASAQYLALLGAGMYGSFVVGGPLGIGLYDMGGFAAVTCACTAAPLIGLVMTCFVPADIPGGGKSRESFRSVIGRVWRHGAVVGLQGMGFATIGAFQALLFKHRGWDHAGAGLASFAVGFVAMRIVGPTLLKRLGGKWLVLISLLVECAGQMMLWKASIPATAIIGAALTGAGCSMIYPAIGSDIVQKVPQKLRGTAMGAFSAFQDLAYGLTGPLTGLAVDHYGDNVAFLIGGLAAIAGIICLNSIPMGRRTKA